MIQAKCKEGLAKNSSKIHNQYDLNPILTLDTPIERGRLSYTSYQSYFSLFAFFHDAIVCENGPPRMILLTSRFLLHSDDVIKLILNKLR